MRDTVILIAVTTLFVNAFLLHLLKRVATAILVSFRGLIQVSREHGWRSGESTATNVTWGQIPVSTLYVG